MQFYICFQNVYHNPGSGSEFNVFGSTTLLRKTKKNKFVRLSCFKLIAGTFCHKKVIFFNHQKIMFFNAQYGLLNFMKKNVSILE